MPTKPRIAKPKNITMQQPSAFVLKCFAEMMKNPSGPIADVACGYGRNAKIFAEAGFHIYCLDNNPEALSEIANFPKTKGKLTPVKINLSEELWPYQAGELGGIVNVHYFQPKLLKHFIYSIRPGGYLIIETINAQGGNYLELPNQGFILSNIQDEFDVISNQEKKVGPKDYDAVTVKCFARKHKEKKDA